MGEIEIRLLERDKKIIKEVDRWRVCQGRHIRELAGFSGQRACDRRLRKLMEAGYLRREKILYGVAGIYRITAKATKVIAGGLQNAHRKIRVEQITHDIAVIDTAIFYSKKYDTSFDKITTEIELHRGEVILQFLMGCREPQTEQEKRYLLPMFEEVYEDAKELNPNLNTDIKLYVMDAMYVNAFAIGRKTVAITRGAIETLSADELKGVIAHELGHIKYGHTKALLLSNIGNLFFSVIVFAFRGTFFIVQTISNIISHFSVIAWFFSLFTYILRLGVDLSILVFINLSEIILAINSRKNEIEADNFTYEIGYGKEMISCLYVFQKISMDTQMKLTEKMKASHPHTAYRIANLERLENGT